MKKCLSCGIEKEYNAFSKNTKTLDGHQSWCKECTSKYHKENYKKNKDIYAAYNKKYRDENASVIRIKQKDHREKNKEKRKANHRAWYAKNREKIKAERAHIPDSDTLSDLVPMIAGGFARWAVISTERRAALGEQAEHWVTGELTGADGMEGNDGTPN